MPGLVCLTASPVCGICADRLAAEGEARSPAFLVRTLASWAPYASDSDEAWDWSVIEDGSTSAEEEL
jgi:hypothetical protein